MKWPFMQCLTIDGLEQSHAAQVAALCQAGADWIQIRMKAASDDDVAEVASACLPKCHEAGVKLIINDRIHVALEVGADGVHLGRLDMNWEDARELAGDGLIIGGTVNSSDDARRAVRSQALNYVGVGPFRFTRTKQNLAPVLSEGQWHDILVELGGLPAYAIGGIEASDLPSLSAWGLQGVAISSGLFRSGDVVEEYENYRREWFAREWNPVGLKHI
ncbi:thiamine phosphate synthase [Puniceicoccaceae bacterium K14]|nr:thiamine phosphate synthase [Puniceicoccaceae bacterium K14]